MVNTPLATLVIAAEESSGADALGLDLAQILVQAGVFVLLFFAVKKFALGPISKTLEDRSKRINDGLDLADRAEKRTEEVQAESAKILGLARKESAGIINDAKTEATTQAAEIEEKSRAKADKIMTDADASIQDQVATAEGKLKEDIITYVRQASEKVLGEKMDAKTDESLIKRVVKEVKA